MSDSSGGGVFQNSVYAGISIQNVLYGIELVLYATTMHFLLNHTGERTKSDIFYAIFSTVMLLLNTIWVFAQLIFCGKMWLLEASYPGGPDAFWSQNISAWYMGLAATAIIVLQLMTDALMIYRCRMVWSSYRVIIAPSILWLGTFVLGILVVWSTATPSGGIYFYKTAAQIALAFYTISVFLTVMLTCMICYRVLGHGRLIKEHLAYEYASPYFAIAALVIESVFPYSLSGIAFVVSLGLRSPTIGAFGYLNSMMVCVSPQMLILRVAMRTAWTKDTCCRHPPSGIEFSPEENMTTTTVPGDSQVLPYVRALWSVTHKGDDAVTV